MKCCANYFPMTEYDLFFWCILDPELLAAFLARHARPSLTSAGESSNCGYILCVRLYIIQGVCVYVCEMFYNGTM